MAKKQNSDNVEEVVNQESPVVEEPVKEEPKKKLFQTSDKGAKLS